MPTLPTPAKFRLTASAIASHYKHRCDRLFRWNAVATADRGKDSSDIMRLRVDHGQRLLHSKVQLPRIQTG